MSRRPDAVAAAAEAGVQVLRQAVAAVEAARPAAGAEVEVQRPVAADAEASRSARHRVAVCAP
jgi:hypothetical protein